MTTVHLIPIPAKTRATPCSSCQQLIYFAPHPSTGRPHPISVKHPNAVEPTATDGGFGVSHFSDCPNAAQHRKAKA